MTFTLRKVNRKFKGGKKKTIRKKRKTRRKRRGGKTSDEIKTCISQKQTEGLGFVAARTECFNSSTVSKPVVETPVVETPVVETPVVDNPVSISKTAPVITNLGCVDDDSAKYGSKGNNNCERLRGKVDWMNNPDNAAQKDEAKAKLREICSRQAGKHCMKTCSEILGKPCPPPVVETQPVVEAAPVVKKAEAVVNESPEDICKKLNKTTSSGSLVATKKCRQNSLCTYRGTKKKKGPCRPKKGGRRKLKRKTKKIRKHRRHRGGVKGRLTKMKRKLTNLKKKLTRKQKGGSLLAPGAFKCNYPTNVGEIFTGIPLNKNPLLPDPINSNSNIVEHVKHQKGGGFLDDIGLGDALLGYYKATNTASNIPIRYKGGQLVMPADPMHQPGLTSGKFIKVTPNVPNMYSSASQTAAQHTIS